MEPTSTEQINEVAGKVPSGCSIVTARHAAAASGMLVSWIQQASMEPVLLSIALRRGRPLLTLIDGSNRLVVNLIGEDQFVALARHFGRGFDLAEDCFAGLEVRQGSYGAILQDAMGYLECSIVARISAGDHLLYIVRPEGGNFITAAAQPYVHIRKTASKY